MSTAAYVNQVLETVKKRNPGEPEFLQAVTEVFRSIVPVLDRGEASIARGGAPLAPIPVEPQPQGPDTSGAPAIPQQQPPPTGGTLVPFGGVKPAPQ